MKRLLKLTAIACAVAMTSCEPQTQQQFDAEMTERITEFHYKGHRYLFFRSSYSQSAVGGITHDPECLCHKKMNYVEIDTNDDKQCE